MKSVVCDFPFFWHDYFTMGLLLYDLKGTRGRQEAISLMVYDLITEIVQYCNATRNVCSSADLLLSKFYTHFGTICTLRYMDHGILL